MVGPSLYERRSVGQQQTRSSHSMPKPLSTYICTCFKGVFTQKGDTDPEGTRADPEVTVRN